MSDVKQISIFMSPFNVHVNRVPSDGKVTMVKHTKGASLPAYKDEASAVQTSISDMVLETRLWRLVLVGQVAGFVARQGPSARVKEGDIVPERPSDMG